MREKWKSIRTYPNYAVSNEGRIRNTKTKHILKYQRRSQSGGNYAFICLYKNGKRKNCNIHGLVARAFIGPRPEGMEVHHKDDNRMNPCVTNLEYVTHQINCSQRR